MAGQDSNDRIAELLKQACPPAEASPGFKAELRQEIVRQSAAPRAARPRPFWQQPLLWMPAAAAAAVAVMLVVYFAAFRSTGLKVVTSDATGIETTTATLNGNLDNLPPKDALLVCFEWGVDTSYGRQTVPEAPTSDGSIQADLSGLEPRTTYHYRLKVVAEDGVRYGPDRTFITGPAPPAVTTGGASSVGAGSATLAGSLGSLGSSHRVEVSFLWGTTEDCGRRTRAQEMTSTGEFTAEIRGLRPDTIYHFRARAEGDGDPVYGADMTFRTGTDPPSVETGEAIATGPGSERITGRLTSMGSAESVAVSLFWGPAPGGPYTEAAAGRPLTREGSFSADLDGLEPRATYYYVACADADGEPVCGEEKSFVAPTVAPSVTTGAPSGVHAESATLHGVLGGLGTAAQAEVYFEWGPTREYGSRTTPETRTSAGAFSATLSGLTPGTTYHFRAGAAGHGEAPGADRVFTTGSAPPARAAWYLGRGPADNMSVMYQGDQSQPEATLVLYSGGRPASRTWVADRPAADTVYAAGDWSVRLLAGRVGLTDNISLEIGTCDNAGLFLPWGSLTFAGLGDDAGAVYSFEDNITVSSFTVPSGGFVAVRVSTTSVRQAYVQVGGSRSFVQSPAHPEPTAPEVTTGAPGEITATTATLRGHLDGLGSSSSVAVYVEWGTGTDYGNRLDAGFRDSTGEFTADVAALEPNTTYHFRAVAEGDGTACGADLAFTTLG